MGEVIHTLHSAPTVTLPCGYRNFIWWARAVYDRCQWCNSPFRRKDKRLAPSRDHLNPRSLKGTNRVDNIVLSCRFCNEQRGNAKPSSRRRFYGPRWKKAPLNLLIYKHLPKHFHGCCRLWIKQEGKKWRILFEGTYVKCHNYKNRYRAKCHGIKTDFMIIPSGVMVREEYREQRLADLVRRSMEAKERLERIAVRAYYKWEDSGRQHGNDLQHWLEAEMEEEK